MRRDNVYDKRGYCTVVHPGSYLVNRGIWWIDDFPQRHCSGSGNIFIPFNTTYTYMAITSIFNCEEKKKLKYKNPN